LPVLTKSAIDRAAPKPAPYVLWDSSLVGFGCRIFPSGRRSFVITYRLPGGRRTFQMALGAYGVLTVTQARAQASAELAKVRMGAEHPLAARRGRQAAVAAQVSPPTVATLVEQYLSALRAGTTSSKRLHGRQATADYIEDTVLHLSRLAAACGKQDVASFNRSDLVRFLNGYVSQPSAHRRLHGAIRRMYAWALRHDLASSNPAEHIETTTAPPRERVLSLAELARIWRAAETLEPVYRDVVHLLITTGQRRAEVAGMTWGEIDLAPPRAVGTTAGGLWTLPAARTKARRQHALPLPPLAVAALQARLAVFLHVPARDDLVLPTLARDGRSVAPISGWNWLKRELDRASGVTDWQMHDFRRSLVTVCAEHGAEVAVLDSMLNHASSATRGGVIGTYQRATLIEPMRKVMALWDRLLSEELHIETRPPAQVLALRAS
jgi:integrase